MISKQYTADLIRSNRDLIEQLLTSNATYFASLTIRSEEAQADDLIVDCLLPEDGYQYEAVRQLELATRCRFLLNLATVQEELAEDIISIIHSFSGKLYGMRNKIKEKLDKELSD